MPRLIALDVGSHAIKVSSYRISGRQVALEERHHQPVPQDGAPPALENRLAAVEAMLDDVPSLRPSGSDVLVMAYPSSLAAFHRVGMPFTDAAQIERTLPFAVENEVPFDLDDMVLGWRISEQVGQTQVMAVLTRHDQLSQWLAALAEKGVDPAAVHVDTDLYGPWGAIEPRWLGDGDDARAVSPLVAVLDVGHAHTTVSVVRNGVVQMARSINVAGWSFTRAIQEALQCSWHEAEQYKHGSLSVEAAPDEDTVDLQPDEEVTDPGKRRHSGYALLPPAARERLDGAIGLLLAELRSTLIQAEDTLGGEVAEVRITGGSARIDELWDYLAQDLGVAIRRATDPAGDPSPGPFALSTALARASVPGNAANPVDLRVGDLAFRGGTNLVRSALAYGLSGAVFFSFAATLMFVYQYWTLASEQSAAEAAVQEIVARALPDVPESTYDTLDKAKAAMAGFTEDATQRAAVLGEGDGIPPTIDALHHLTKAFPPHPDVTVEVSDLTIIPGTSITFNAETADYASSAKIEDTLRADARFSQATKGQETKMSDGRIKFPITIPLGDGETSSEEG